MPVEPPQIHRREILRTVSSSDRADREPGDECHAPQHVDAVQPGTSNFLLSGYGFLNYFDADRDDSTFTAVA